MQNVQIIEDYFVYQLDFTALAGGTTANASIQIQADSDFKWVKSTYHANIANAILTDSTRVIALATINVTDTGSGRQLMSAPVPIENIFGVGLVPYILPVPRIFRARSTISVSLANFTAATTYNIRLSFIGTKLFKMGG